MKSLPLTRALPLIALVVAGMAAFAPGCGGDSGGNPPDGNTGGTVNTGGSGGSGGTGGTGGSGGTQPTACTDDSGCPESEHCEIPAGATEGSCVDDCIVDSDCGFDTGLRCDDDDTSGTYGRCIQAEECQESSTCAQTADYCGRPGTDAACVCVPDSTADESAGNTGICRRRTPTCSPCQTDEECGPNRFDFNEPRECKPFVVGDDSSNVCLPKKGAGSCPAGTVPADTSQFPDLAGYCVPQSLDCGDWNPCRSDLDCADNPSAPVCDMSRQICIPGCTFDYQRHKSLGCSPSQVCHPIPSNLDPELLAECSTVAAFGQGKCGAQCDPTDPNTCSAYDGGTGKYQCVAEPDTGERRCRPVGCLNDFECEVPNSQEYLGYCEIKADFTQNRCVSDGCRIGTDPRAGCGANQPYTDCSSDFKCVDQAGEGVCLEKNCIDKGGAGSGCRLGEFCAGEPLLDMITGQPQGAFDPASKLGVNGVPTGECFGLDPAVWCEEGCQSNNDCNGLYSYTDTPDVCMNHPDGEAKCTYGCEYNAECPGRWECSSKGLEMLCADPQGANDGLKKCSVDSDCGAGNRCVDPILGGSTFNNWPQGMAPFKVCECSATDACGAGWECNAGLGTIGLRKENAATYEVRQARYCSKAGQCGANGSCEWFGNTASLSPTGPIVPLFMCGATPDVTIFPGNGSARETVECPAQDGGGNPVRKGKQEVDKYRCVLSSVCQPRYYGPADAPECGVPPAPPAP